MTVMKPNVILIVCDALRKDIMDLYGGPARMPNMRKLAREAMVYENCIAPATWTFPSHASLFTGMYPSQHGVHETRELKAGACAKLNKTLGAPRLAEQLEQEGYNTICISNNYMISRHSGFDYGFKTFMNLESSPWVQSDIAAEASRLGADPLQVLKALVKTGKIHKIPTYAKELLRIRKLADAKDWPTRKGADFVLDILENTSLSRNFFLFINFFEMHDPYKGENWREMLDNVFDVKKLNGRKVDYLKHQYVLSGEFLDEQIGRLVKLLKARGLYDSTMLIITSDHGQAFNEHGVMYHGDYLYDEILRVPLIVKYPMLKKFKKRKGYQSLVCVPAMIFDILGGRDDSALTRREVFAESYGSIGGVPKSYRHMKEYFVQRYEKVRKAAYMDGYKLTLNGTDGTVEEFMKNGRNISTSSGGNIRMLKLLVNEIDKFRGREEFELPAV
jgi:arylsulfatase A-like enzyme